MADMNNDNEFELWVHYALVPNSEVTKVNGEINSAPGNEVGTTGAWNHVHYGIKNDCDSPCNSQAVLTGFEMDFTNDFFFDQDLDEIEVGVQAYHTDYVFAMVRFNDWDKSDNFHWSVQYALIK